jgi:hypothetical protein
MDLLEDLKSCRSEVDPRTVAGHLLGITDPNTGKRLTDQQLAAEIGIFFFAGMSLDEEKRPFLPQQLITPDLQFLLIFPLIGSEVSHLVCGDTFARTCV